MTIARNGMIHLNNNLLCAINLETTGEVAGTHDIYQMCVLPLGAELTPTPGIVPFYCDMQLRRPENIDSKRFGKRREQICAAQTNGLDPWRAADLLDEWFQKLQLRYGKQIAPLCYDWSRDRAFLLEWLGPETFTQLFTPNYRDLLSASLFANDRADWHNEPVPYAKNDFKWLSSVFRIPMGRTRDSMERCRVVAEVYRQMCKA